MFLLFNKTSKKRFVVACDYINKKYVMLVMLKYIITIILRKKHKIGEKKNKNNFSKNYPRLSGTIEKFHK